MTATQDAVAIMFYGAGQVSIEQTASIQASIDVVKSKLLRDRNIFTYNGSSVVIDNDNRTITFNGNIAIIDTQGNNAVTLGTNNKSASFTAEGSSFSGSMMGILVYKANDNLAVKQYNQLAIDDYALIGLKFDKALGSGSTPATNTKVQSYVSNLPIKLIGGVPSDTDNLLNCIIVEKTASIDGLGNNTFSPYKEIGTLTPGQTYYLYVNNYAHTSATSGYLFAFRKNNTVMQAWQYDSTISSPAFTFVAEEGAIYSFSGRCDIGDSIQIKLLTHEVEGGIDVDAVKEVCRNNNFLPLVQSIIKSVDKNPKIASFFYVTDLHGNLSSLKEMVRLKANLGLASVTALLNSGDNVGGWPRTTANQAIIDEYMQICAANNVYHVVGQHEVGFAPSANPEAEIGRSKSDVYSTQETFNRYFAPLKNGWGLPNLDKCYYYKDFGNVRLIALYHYNRPEVDDPNDSDYYKYQRALVWYGTEQLQWFADTLGSMSDGQVAVILCHQPTKVITPLNTSKFQDGFYASSPNNITTDDPITEIINAFKNKTQLVKTYTPTDTTKYLVEDGFEESVSVDFSNAEGTFGFMLMGDNHFDDVGKASNTLCLCLTSSGVCTDGVITTNTGYNSDYIINALGVRASSVELGRVGQQYFRGTLRDIERLSYNI